VAGTLVWRIARRVHALDKRGAGARANGGRWNEVGTAAIYAGSTIAIAALETFVHVAGIVPADLVLVRIELPTGCSTEKPRFANLPRHWDSLPVAPGSMAFGSKWARESRSLVLYVPSALIPEEVNAVLNPNHPEFGGVKMAIQRPFHYDARMYS
jgi:RES domain-containing protein